VIHTTAVTELLPCLGVSARLWCTKSSWAFSFQVSPTCSRHGGVQAP